MLGNVLLNKGEMDLVPVQFVLIHIIYFLLLRL